MANANSSGGNFGAELSPGSRIGGARFLLKRLVGRGEFSELWLARDIKNVKDIALKFLPRAFLQDPNLLEQFQQEISRNRLLKHPHIVPVYELVRDYDAVAIAMEFVDGWSLATLKVDKTDHCYSVKEIEPWIRDLCDALSYAHNEFGMVHGDLKPSNLLSSTREGIKVSDFGFAALSRNESSKRGIIKSVSGGMGFLSPQQVMGEPPSKLDDIYSLGATIFDLLTGTPPFYKGEVIAQICGLKPPGMTQHLSELGVKGEPISPIWEETIARCLAKNPADRPQSVEEVWRLLERQESSLSPNSPETPETAETPATQETAETPDGEEPDTQIAPPIEASPTNSKQAMALLAGVLAVLLIAGLAMAFWFIHRGKLHATPVSSHSAISSGNSSPGSLDKSFNAGTGADGSIRSLALLPGGTILIGGLFENFNAIAARKIVRLKANGSQDPAFAPQPPGNVFAILPESDGKILIGGENMEPGRSGRKLIQLNADGSPEPFGAEGDYNKEIRAIALEPDSKVLVGGSFNRAFGKQQNGLARLTADGKLDDSFNIGQGAAAIVWSIVVQPDGKILVAGAFKKFNGRKTGRLVRLNPDGSFDSGFDNGNGADAGIMTVLLQNDGKILICGGFNHVSGSPYPHIARLNPDGSLDAGFHPSNGLGDVLRSMALQSDGKIIVGGYGQSRPFLARLNADGSLDEKFQVTEPTGGSIWHVAVQSDGKILVAGMFDSFDNASCGNIVRLQN
jgi:uncharacterized delta-60 repeat protein